jgi:hypothetical protein
MYFELAVLRAVKTVMIPTPRERLGVRLADWAGRHERFSG